MGSGVRRKEGLALRLEATELSTGFSTESWRRVTEHWNFGRHRRLVDRHIFAAP